MDGTSIAERKRALRAAMRAVRRALPDQDQRSRALWAHVEALPAVAAADVVMVFDSVLGEPLTAPFIAWCEEMGKQVWVPEADPPPDPRSVDVVIVPGTAFTPAGDRLGQGGGWYDRFLGAVRPECVSIGVAFSPQLVDALPVEPHDVGVDVVVTEAGVAGRRSTRRRATR